jgi:septal ring factor EnvC (AmiA/AmiB activator)
MQETGESNNLVAGFFNLVALRKEVKEHLEAEKEKVTNLKKQLKEIDKEMEQKGEDIISTVKERGEISAKITLEDFFDK